MQKSNNPPSQKPPKASIWMRIKRWWQKLELTHRYQIVQIGLVSLGIIVTIVIALISH